MTAPENFTARREKPKHQRPRGYAPWRPQAKTQVVLDQIYAILDEYVDHLPLTCRQIFYRLVGAFGFPKDENAYERVCEYLNRARRAKLIPFESIRDDKITTINHAWYSGEEDFWDDVGRQVHSYQEDRQARQRVRLELWCEATGMLPQIDKIARRYSVPTYSVGGFNGVTANKEIAARAADRLVPTVLLHVGDFDPSGESIFWAMAEDAAAFVREDRVLANIELHAQRVALTREQVEHFGLTTAPPKSSDRRSKNWVGGTCQLEALAPDLLAHIVEEAIVEHLNVDVLEQVVDEERENQAALYLALSGRRRRMTVNALLSENFEAEQAVLGSMLMNADAVRVVIDQVGLDGREFRDRHMPIFWAMRDLYQERKPVDPIAVVEELERRRGFEKLGGKNYIHVLGSTVPAVGNVKHYAEIVHTRYIERKQGKVGADLVAGGDRGTALQQLSALEKEARVEESSWKPVNLGDALAGRAAPGPTLLERTDGHALFYQGLIHQIAAEPEAGKTFLALKAAAEVLGDGGLVAYYDFESTAPEIVSRLRALGVGEDLIRDQFVYVAPHEPIVVSELEAVLAMKPVLVIIDGVTEAMTLHGLSLVDNEDVAKWLELLPRPAMRSGAATVLIDHVVKDRESRGRFAIGAAHKLAGIHVAYALEVVEPFGRGKQGTVRVKVMKDRPGHIRTHEVGDGEIATMRLASDSETDSVIVELDPPSDFSDDGDTFRPTHLMQRVSEAVESEPGITTSAIRRVKGKGSGLDQALRVLIDEGYVDRKQDGIAHRHYPLKPFTETEAGPQW